MITDSWIGLYKEKWKGEIVNEAMAHPAKFSRALIRKIYGHLIRDGYLKPGDQVVDPFGGVGLGALDATVSGINWTGVELEPRFVELGNRNLDLWRNYFSERAALLGAARLIQGDSRQLARVIAEADAVISSPPYSSRTVHGDCGIDQSKFVKGGGPNCQANAMDRYGETDGNLGNLPVGDFNAIVSSPPFLESLASDDPDKRGGLFRDEKRRCDRTLTAVYGETEGQLGAMPSGEYDAVVSSPPYSAVNPAKNSSGIDREKQYESYRASGGRASFEAFCKTQELHSQGYGESDGQLSGMRTGDFDAAISSPPYEGMMNSSAGGIDWEKAGRLDRTKKSDKRFAVEGTEQEKRYGDTDGQTGAMTGDTFWSASRIILEQAHSILKPGAVCSFVLKDFVRDGEIVPFSMNWLKLCERVGFRAIHWHRAMLIEQHGHQQTFSGEDHAVETHRKSFFRRLHEKNGSPAINHENVICLVKP